MTDPDITRRNRAAKRAGAQYQMCIRDSEAGRCPVGIRSDQLVSGTGIPNRGTAASGGQRRG